MVSSSFSVSGNLELSFLYFSFFVIKLYQSWLDGCDFYWLTGWHTVLIDWLTRWLSEEMLSRTNLRVTHKITKQLPTSVLRL